MGDDVKRSLGDEATFAEAKIRPAREVSSLGEERTTGSTSAVSIPIQGHRSRSEAPKRSITVAPSGVCRRRSTRW